MSMLRLSRLSRFRLKTGVVLALGLVLCLAVSAMADRPHGRSWVYDGRYNHSHYYPARGVVFMDLPPASIRVSHGHASFFFSSGVWYRPMGPRYVVAVPPPGLLIPVLPPYYSVIYVGNVPYYYANSVYYQPAPGGYVVVPPPQGAVVVAPAPVPQQIAAPPSAMSRPMPNEAMEAPQPAPKSFFVYPRKGQSQKRIDTDRAECSRWASKQTGYQEDSGDMQGSADYQRAMAACLEGRDYTVR